LEKEKRRHRIVHVDSDLGATMYIEKLIHSASEGNTRLSQKKQNGDKTDRAKNKAPNEDLESGGGAGRGRGVREQIKKKTRKEGKRAIMEANSIAS